MTSKYWTGSGWVLDDGNSTISPRSAGTAVLAATSVLSAVSLLRISVKCDRNFGLRFANGAGVAYRLAPSYGAFDPGRYWSPVMQNDESGTPAR